MSSNSLTAEATFVGYASMGGMEVNLSWKVTEVTGNNFKFNQTLSLNGQVLEDSCGTGSFNENENADGANLVFEDDQTSFTGVYDFGSGNFNGNSTQKDGSGVGTFELKRY
jgi:hypothetical protein